MKILKQIILSFFIIALTILKVNAFSTPVYFVFSDISKDYKYYNELQTLYDKGMISPDSEGKFNPQKLLTRDEFVGIASESSCKKCIKPNTSSEFIEKYTTKPFFDVELNNKYFYCISYAKDNNFVNGYDISHTCEDGVNEIGQKPFCINNYITLEEALAVILRMSGILSANEAEEIRQRILAGEEFPDLSLDVKSRNSDGSVYSFYPDFAKALNYEIIDYDNDGNEISFNLLEKTGDYLYPKKNITKEEFLKLAYGISRFSSCTDNIENNLSVKINIFDKSCSEDKVNCKKSDLLDEQFTFDFEGETFGVCEAGINDENYVWRFYKEETGEEIFKFGRYINNYKFLEKGNRKVFLRVTDNCGNIGEANVSLNINDDNKYDTGVTVDIIPYDNGCTEDSDCKEIDLGGDEAEYDFGSNISTSCKKGIEEENYMWNFSNSETGENYTRVGKYINNFEFLDNGLRTIKLEVTDNCGNTGMSVLTKIIGNNGLNVDIIPHDKDCNENSNCDETDLGGDETEYDFGSNIGGVCEAGINDENYIWTFNNINTKEVQVIKRKYIDNFEFLSLGKRIITLEVTDNCGNKGYSKVTKVITEDIDDGLSVILNGDPIIGEGPLASNLIGVISGGEGPYKYEWDFGDGSTGIGNKNIHIFKEEGVYEVKLTVTDVNGLTGEATILVKVLSGTDCESDKDGDSIGDCIDRCPNVLGDVKNFGCPVFEVSCNNDCSCIDGYICTSDNPNTCGNSGVCLPEVSLGGGDFGDGSWCGNAGDDKTGLIQANAVCQSCPCPYLLDFAAEVRACDSLFPAITSPDSSSIYSKGGLYQVK